MLALISDAIAAMLRCVAAAGIAAEVQLCSTSHLASDTKGDNFKKGNNAPATTLREMTGLIALAVAALAVVCLGALSITSQRNELLVGSYNVGHDMPGKPAHVQPHGFGRWL